MKKVSKMLLVLSLGVAASACGGAVVAGSTGAGTDASSGTGLGAQPPDGTAAGTSDNTGTLDDGTAYRTGGFFTATAAGSPTGAVVVIGTGSETSSVGPDSATFSGVATGTDMFSDFGTGSAFSTGSTSDTGTGVGTAIITMVETATGTGTAIVVTYATATGT
jgi:hypothetical protein